MKNIFPKFALKQLSTYISIIVIFVHNVVLDRNLKCSCEQQAHHCNYYMILPFFILFILHLWTDKSFQRELKYWCTFFWVLLYDLLKAALVGLLWVSSVLIDGDWYVCCHNDRSDKQAKLACKREENLTPEERAIVAKLKNESLVSFSLNAPRASDQLDAVSERRAEPRLRKTFVC